MKKVILGLVLLSTMALADCVVKIVTIDGEPVTVVVCSDE